MVQRHRRDHGDFGPGDHVGGVQPSAEAGLQHGEVGLNAREGEEGRRRGDLEEGDGMGVVGGFALGQQSGQRPVADLPAGGPDALGEAHQVGGGIDVGLAPGGVGHRRDEGDDGALAVGAGDVDDRRQVAFRIAQGA